MIELSIGYYLLEIQGRVELGYAEAYQSELNNVHKHLKEVVIVTSFYFQAPKTQIRSQLRELNGLIDGSISVENALSTLLRKYRNDVAIIKQIFKSVVENLIEYSKTCTEYVNVI